MNNWSFLPICDKARRARLAEAPEFERIAQAVAKSMRILCTHSEPCDEAAGYARIVCCVAVEPDLFDVFFNAESGYRGRYFASPEDGVHANGELLGLVACSLAKHTSHKDLPYVQAEQSLRVASAKCWLAEVGKGFCRTCRACEGEWTPPQDATADFLNDRWEHGQEVMARYGRKAPLFTKLRILGGFVDPAGREYVATQKRERAQHIHRFGWS